jgi:hypothetical protein
LGILLNGKQLCQKSYYAKESLNNDGYINSTIINKKNNLILTELIEHKKDHDI